jgi:hypothetical protein
LTLQSGELVFNLRLEFQRVISATFELGGNQAVGGIHRIVLPPRMGYLIARPLETQLLVMDPLISRALQTLGRLQRRLNRKRLEAFEYLLRDKTIGSHSTEADATFRAWFLSVATTLIACAGPRVLRQQLRAARP